MALSSHLATHREKLGLQIFLLHSFATCAPQSIGILFVFLLREMDGSNLQPQQNWIDINSPLTPPLLQSGLVEIKNKTKKGNKRKSMTARRYNVQKTKARGPLLLQK